MIDKEDVKKLKEKYPNKRIFFAELDFVDPEKNRKHVEFPFRQPKVADMEVYSKNARQSNVHANYNLLMSVILADDPKAIMDELEDSPNVVGTFVNERIIPFFGEHQASEIVEL